MRLLKSVVTLALVTSVCVGLTPSLAQAAGGTLRGSGSVEEAWLTGADTVTSTSLFTDPTYRSRDEKELSSRRDSLLSIPLDPIAHTFRPGTDLRIVASAPGGDRPVWTFNTVDSGQPATVGLGGAAASTLTINVVPNIRATTTAPVCGSLRGEPCRPYTAEGNQP